MQPKSRTDPTSLEGALGRAYRLLGRRDHTCEQMRSALLRAGFAPPTIDEALDLLAEQGYLDDARFVRRFTEDRRQLDGWGRARIRDALLAAGVDRDLVDAGLAACADDGELAAALALLERRAPSPPLDERSRGRAFGLLVRRGFDSELAYAAIRRHEAGVD